MNTQRDRDLFGVPLDPHHGRRGRPRHKPTAEMRQRVRELRDGGASLPSIAAALHITEPTLARHYRDQVGWRRPDLRVQKGESAMNAEADRDTGVVPDPALEIAARAAKRNQETLRRLEVAQFCRLGAKAANSGAGREARLASALALLPIEDSDLVLATLDEIASPMSARELEKALMVTKLGFVERKAVVSALKGVQILMVRQS